MYQNKETESIKLKTKQTQKSIKIILCQQATVFLRCFQNQPI